MRYTVKLFKNHVRNDYYTKLLASTKRSGIDMVKAMDLFIANFGEDELINRFQGELVLIKKDDISDIKRIIKDSHKLPFTMSLVDIWEKLVKHDVRMAELTNKKNESILNRKM